MIGSGVRGSVFRNWPGQSWIRTVDSFRPIPKNQTPDPCRSLPGAGEHYIVINSGHTFREAELSKLNYLLFPRWGDWAVLEIDPRGTAKEPAAETVLQAGYFNEQWK
jgi:hypothetical protein